MVNYAKCLANETFISKIGHKGLIFYYVVKTQTLLWLPTCVKKSLIYMVKWNYYT
jgi:hypothetical protein